MTKRATTFLFAAALLGVAGMRIEPAAAASSSPPATLRGTGTTPTASANDNGASDGASIVLRGSTPPPTPSFAGFPCPPGYTYDPDTGCIVAGDGSSYGAEPYDWWYWPYDFGHRRPFRPRRHAALGFARGGLARSTGFHGMPVAHGFGGGHR
jgi:hypothetical protein